MSKFLDVGCRSHDGPLNFNKINEYHDCEHQKYKKRSAQKYQ